MPTYEKDFYSYSDDYSDDYNYGNVPKGEFWDKVDDFNEWDTIWDQYSYEERLN